MCDGLVYCWCKGSGEEGYWTGRSDVGWNSWPYRQKETQEESQTPPEVDEESS